MKKLNPFLLFLALFASFNGVSQDLIHRDQLDYTPNLSDIWGWTDGTKEYAIVGLRNGVSIVDVTNPDDVFEVQFIYGTSCTWRDIKTWGNYAYVTHDCVGQSAGLNIIDLSQLPDTVITYPWRTDGTIPNLVEAHNLYIDEFGFAYIAGHNIGNGGVIILDLNVTPTNPTVAGQYTSAYVHDCYVENNILYTGEIGIGKFAIVDVTNKANPVILAKYDTPGENSHNIWPSNNKNFVFTTDETVATNATVASFDISDLSDIKLLDEFNSTPSSVPHNVHVLDDYLIVSHYSHGVNILDAAQPDKLVEIAHYDTSPNYTGDNYNGCWGAYPFFPSGTVVASDQQTGLHVFTPEYKRAIHVRGTVYNAVTENVLFDAQVQIFESGNTHLVGTNLSGKFKEGYKNQGEVVVSVTKDGYYPWQNTYTLEHGDLIDLDIYLVPIVEPTDTIYAEIEVEQTSTICSEVSIEADTAFSCFVPYTSDFGSWMVDDAGCLTYTAFETTGSFLDTICMVVINEDGSESEATVVIVSISQNITSAFDNAFDNGEFTLLQNPVKDRLYIKSNLNKREELNFTVYNIGGHKMSETNLSGFNELLSIPLNDLPRGLYVVIIQAQNGIGTLKFMVQ
jgi:choice-of-anchor B domain-containing protein